jgi:hypothetical protein
MPGNTRNPIRRDWVISWDCRLWGSVFKQTQEPQAKAFAASIGCLLRGSHPNRLGPFVAAYLTSIAWIQLDIGLVLTIGMLAAVRARLR